MGPALIIALFVVVVILIAVGGYYARKRRILLWQQTAASLGLRYSTEHPFDLLEMPFDLFSRGEGRGTENVLWGTKDGLDVKAFEFWDYTESSDGKGNTSRSYEHFSCALLPIAASCPHTTIAPEGFFSRIGRALGFHDIEFESEEFNKHMKVKSAEPKFATYLVDPRMMEWLLANKGWQFELSDRSLLTYCGRVHPQDIGTVLAAAEGFHQHIPRVIDETFKEGS
jgi:hypothetical protein